MLTKLSKHGDGLALVIDPAILERLGLDEHTALELTVEGRALVVASVGADERHLRFDAGFRASHARYSDVLKRLA